jgi:hypothetical protein
VTARDAGAGRTVKVLVAEREVLDALASGPKSSREISEITVHAARKAWADENGVDYDPNNPAPFVKLLGWHTASERGLSPMHAWEVYAVARRLEKRGEIVRVQIDGRRPMLWRLA